MIYFIWPASLWSMTFNGQLSHHRVSAQDFNPINGFTDYPCGCWKAFLSGHVCWMKFSSSFCQLDYTGGLIKKKKTRKNHDYKHAHIEIRALRICTESWIFYTKGESEVAMVKCHKVFPLEQLTRQNQGRLFKVMNINVPCNCIPVWPETPLNYSVLRVTFPYLQNIPSLLMLFSTLAQMTSAPSFPPPQAHQVPDSDLKGKITHHLKSTYTQIPTDTCSLSCQIHRVDVCT